MKNKGKTRRLKMAAWAAFMLPLLALNTNLATEGTSDDTDHATVHRELYAAGPSTFYKSYGAYTADYYEQPYFVGDYFRNLVDHFPTNNCGNCGYTAAAMLLCYYDTYWNGNIIDDRFNSDPAMISDPQTPDYSSPGIKDYAADIGKVDKSRKPKAGAPQQEWDVYNAYLYEIYYPYVTKMLDPGILDFNLISYLYNLAQGKNQTKTVLWDFGVNNPTTEADGILVRNLLNLYFSELGMSNYIEAKMVHFSNFPSIHGPISPLAQRLALRRAAMGKLRKGQPIIYMGNLFDVETGFYDKNGVYNSDGGHIAIAYGLDKEENTIIGHLGWKGEKEYAHMNFDEVFGDFNAFIYLDVKPDLDFTHPNERFNAGKPVSACELYSHVHADEDHRAKIFYGDTEYHASQCICGDTEYEMHEYDEMVQFDDQKHALKCVCGDAKYEEHTLTVTPYGSLYHMFGCECGYQRKEFHHFRLGGMMRFVCSDCGFSMPAGIMPEIIYNP